MRAPAPPGYEWVKIRDMEPSAIITNGCDCYPWTKFYAWLPVKTLKGKVVWGRSIYRRKVWLVWGNGFHMEPEVQYAELFDILEQS